MKTTCAGTFAIVALFVAAFAQTSQVSSRVKIEGKASKQMIWTRVEPQYPSDVPPNLTRWTVIDLLVGRDGKVAEVSARKSGEKWEESFAKEAVTAARQWQYEPFTRDGVAQEFETTTIIGIPAGEETRLYSPSDGVTPPRGKVTPDPPYSYEGHKARIQGKVVLWGIVGSDGKFHNATVVKPLGYGLDEEAVKTVSGWRFQPSHKDGKPVAVQINIEVNFRLYRGR